VNRYRFKRALAVLLLPLLVLVALPIVSMALGSVGAAARHPRAEPRIKRHEGPPPRRLLVKDLLPGHGRRVRDGIRLTVNYVGALYRSGKVFDSSWRRHEPFTFVLGSDQIIRGWERGLVGMRLGERRELTIPPRLAYGRQGSPPSIPPSSTLVYVVDLLAAQRPTAPNGAGGTR
jgi:FKBP-type peptidyl-prolyl cis-trans isomerase